MAEQTTKTTRREIIFGVLPKKSRKIQDNMYLVLSSEICDHNNDMFRALKDCNDETPVPTKLKRAFGIDGYATFQSYYTGSLHDGMFKGGMVMPFNIMSASSMAGYSADIEGLPGVGENIDVVNVHSDTTDNTNAIPMQAHSQKDGLVGINIATLQSTEF